MLGSLLMFRGREGQGEGGELTSSAYFLHRAASFSSGVLSVFNVCISNVISFPAKDREQRHGPLSLGVPSRHGPTYLTLHFYLLNWLPYLLQCVLHEVCNQLNSAYQCSPVLSLEPLAEDMLNKYLLNE